jgi:hypothetical protein
VNDKPTPDRTTVLRITIDHPVGEVDREQLGVSYVLSEDEISRSYVNPVQLQLLLLVDQMLVTYRYVTQVAGCAQHDGKHPVGQCEEV